MSAILLDEKMVHYEVLGRGRPIIFVHGWVGSWRYWVPAMQTAAVSFRAYALDLWGFGDTAKDPNLYSLKQQAYLLDRFMEAMGIGKVALIGHGLGALAAILFAHKFPLAVDRVMVVNVPLEPKFAAERLRKPASPADLADWLLGKDPLTDLARVEVSKADPYAISASFDSFDPAGITPTLRSLETACLMVHGLNDPAVQIPDNEQVMSMPETVHQVVFEESGHFPMLDESKSFNRLMTDFLSLESGDSPRELQMKEEWKRRVR
jgi:pimeloyl-ACP methyl ester carboxylesterase